MGAEGAWARVGWTCLSKPALENESSDDGGMLCILNALTPAGLLRWLYGGGVCIDVYGGGVYSGGMYRCVYRCVEWRCVKWWSV